MIQTTPATLDQLIGRGLDVRFTRNVNQRPRCEIYHWNGTMLAHANAITPALALREAIKGLEFLDDQPEQERQTPRRRLYEELRKRGINP